MPFQTKIISIDAFSTLVAAERIPKGEIIFPLSGIRSKKPNKYSIQISETEHLLPNSDNPDDPTSLWRVMNHSCNPNSMFDIEKRIVLALRDISVNEEIRWNYNTTEYEMASPFLCGCCSANCYHTIRGFKYLSDRERKNIKHLAPHIKKLLQASFL